MIYDLIVAGAGASGMTAAICATDADIYKQFQHKADQTRKRSVLIIEKNKKIGKNYMQPEMADVICQTAVFVWNVTIVKMNFFHIR